MFAHLFTVCLKSSKLPNKFYDICQGKSCTSLVTNTVGHKPCKNIVNFIVGFIEWRRNVVYPVRK